MPYPFDRVPVIALLAALSGCPGPEPAGLAIDQLRECAAEQTCLPTAWFFDNFSGMNDPGEFDAATQVCAFEQLAAPPATMEFGRAPAPSVQVEGEALIVARWTDGSTSCVRNTFDSTFEIESSTAIDCVLPDSFFDDCAAAAATGTLPRECVDIEMWPFTKYEEVDAVRCGPR